MSTLIQDGQGNTSHKRVINILAAVCAVILTIGLPAWAIFKSAPDIGSNMALLIGSLWAIAAGGAIASNIVEGKK
jgi:hypothetical protein